MGLASEQHGAHPGEERTRTFVAWVLRHGRTLWIIAILLAIPASWRTYVLYSHLRSDLEELLPRDAPSVRALEELRTRLAGLEYLGVVVDTGDAAHLPNGEKFLDDLAARVRTYPPELVSDVRSSEKREQTFIEEHGPLYVERGDLQTILTRIEARRDFEVARETGGLLEDEDPPPLAFDDLQKKYDGRVSGRHFPEGRFSDPEHHTSLLLIQISSYSPGQAQGGQLFDRVRREVRDLGGAEAYGPNMHVGYTGNVAIAVEELSALVSDLSISSVLVVVAVGAVILLYYRWWRALLILVPPLLLATVYSFGLASLWPFSITELNSNTAFLGSIIVGNGINFGIILLGRYVEERRRQQAPVDALVQSVWSAREGTLAGALAAGASYASLAITQFRGFRQFGIIGGMGMLFAWLAAFVLMPPLISWLDWSPATAPRGAPEGRIMVAISRVVARAPKVIVGVAVVLTIGALWKARTLGASELEYDFGKLRRADTWSEGEGFWGRKMDDLLGQYLTPLVILTDDTDQARRVADRLRAAMEKPPLSEMIGSIRTLDDVVPQDQPAKIALASRIREAVTPKIRAALTDEQRRALDRLVGREGLRQINIEEVPETFTAALRERTGELGRTVLIYPRPSQTLWEGPTIAAFVSSLRQISKEAAGPTARPPRVAGSLPLSADIIDSIRRDGLLASAMALGSVIAVVVLIFRTRATTLFVIGSLLLGVLWLSASLVVLHVKINFVNFIAFPITFGIGVDYSVNVMSRYVREGCKDVIHAMRTTGGAVGLCSLTTSIGYSSLLLAQNRALYLFGTVAVLGEVCCLVTAVTVLPATLFLIDARRKKLTPAAPVHLGHDRPTILVVQEPARSGK